MGTPDASPVGYHVFYTLLPLTLPDGMRAESPFRGPLRDGDGNVVRLPLGVDIAKLPLESGRYRLVPVDETDRQVDSVQPVEVVVPVPLTRLDPRTLVLEVSKRVTERMQREGALAEQIVRGISDDARTLLHVQAQQRTHGERYAAAMTARTPEERVAAIDRIADEMIAMFVETARDGGLVQGDHPMPVTRAAIRALAKEPLRCSLHAIRGAVDRLDYSDATARAIARMSIGVEFPASELVDLLPGIGDPMVAFALTALASFDRAVATLQWVRAGAFPASPLDNSCRASALFAAWRLGDQTAVRSVIIPLARAVARGKLFDEARALVCVLADELADPGLTEIVERCGRASGDVIRKAVEFADWAMGLSVDELLAGLPPGVEAADEGRPVARNALCPCGSGRKVKRCCGNDVSTESAVPAPVAARRVPDLTIENVSTISLRDLGEQPFPSTPDVVPYVTDRFARVHHWRQAIAWAEHASAVGVQPYADMSHTTIAEQAMHAGIIDLAIAHAGRVANVDYLSPGVTIALAVLGRDADPLGLIGVYAGDLQDPDVAESFALAMLVALPPLGLLLARGCIDPNRTKCDRIVEAVERVRDKAGLPPFDPAWNLRERLRPGAAEETKRLRGELADARDELHAIRARLASETRRAAGLEVDLEQVRRELNRRTPPPIAIEPAERRTLRTRIDALEAMIREGNEERAELRRAAIEHEASATEPSSARVIEPDDAQADEGEAVPVRARRALVPDVSRPVANAMREVPQHVAAEAMRTLGQLAAGDVAAWQSVKQAKGATPPIYTARIGIHHRLIFRIDDQTIHALELVTREDLLGTMKRLRARVHRTPRKP